MLASLALHALLGVLLSGPERGAGPPAPPLVARLLPPAVPDVVPVLPAPPPVVKNTLDPPKPEVLEDPIGPQPRRRITEQPAPPPPPARKPPAPKPRVPPPSEPAEAPSAVPAPSSPVAATEEAPRRPLDLAIPADVRERRAERLSPQELNETLTRLSETMLYPSEALRRGLEGEVVIVVELGEGGRILDAGIASGSGHAVLDEAAVRAVRRLGTLGPSTAHRTILLPVRFRIL